MYSTSRSNEFHLPRTRTILTYSIFTTAGPKFWNTLDNNVKSAPSIASFKKRLKLILLNYYKESIANQQQP